jgi:hydrogenase-4 component F
LLGVVFMGMGATVLAVVQGEPSGRDDTTSYRDSAGTCVPILIFLALVLLLGVYLPPPLESLLRNAAASLEVK